MDDHLWSCLPDVICIVEPQLKVLYAVGLLTNGPDRSCMLKVLDEML